MSILRLLCTCFENRQLRLRLVHIPALILAAMFSAPTNAQPPVGSCDNTSNECMAKIATIYVDGSLAFVFLLGNLKPSICTAAPYGTAWMLDLTAAGSSAKLSMLLTAHTTGEAVGLRTYASNCALNAARLVG